MEITLLTYDARDIVINNEIVLRIISNDEGYSFDIYSKSYTTKKTMMKDI